MSIIRFNEDVVLPTPEVTLRLAGEPHPYEVLHAGEIEVNWQAEQARNPALFDGRTVLFSRIGLQGGRLVGACHEVRYASLLHWRLARRTDMAAHLFAMAVPVTADGAVLTVRMAPWTANPGQVYFAGGSLEPSDFVDGIADVDANMQREVLEETGLALADLPRDAGYRVVRTGQGVVVVRRYALPLTAREIEDRVRSFVAEEERPEIVGPVLVTPATPADPELLPWVRLIVDWHFSTPFDV